MTLPIGSIGAALPSIGAAAPTPAAGSDAGGFGKALQGELQKLSDSQAQAADQAQQLATGQATDVTSVVMSVEKASLELQLAAQVRNKAVEAYQEIFRMQV